MRTTHVKLRLWKKRSSDYRMNSPTAQELKELAHFCKLLADSYSYDFAGNHRDKLRRIHELLAKLAEEELSK